MSVSSFLCCQCLVFACIRTLAAPALAVLTFAYAAVHLLVQVKSPVRVKRPCGLLCDLCGPCMCCVWTGCTLILWLYLAYAQCSCPALALLLQFMLCPCQHPRAGVPAQKRPHLHPPVNQTQVRHAVVS